MMKKVMFASELKVLSKEFRYEMAILGMLSKF